MNAPAGRPRGVSTPRGWSAALFVLALVLYLALAPPVDGEGDASEFTLALALAGVPHPTGYPLFTLLGHLFVRLLHAAGIGWSMAAAAWSAAGAALAVALAHRLFAGIAAAAAVHDGGDEADGRARALALAPTALLALSPAWIPSATQAEVYGWHLAWFVAAALVLWNGLRAGPEANPRRLALLWGLVAGLGLAHHRTSLFLMSAGSLALLGAAWRSHRFRAGQIALAGLAAIGPLFSYLWIFYRGAHPAAHQWPLLQPGLISAWELIQGKIYARAYLGGFAPTADQRHLLMTSVLPLLLPALVGLAMMLARGGRAGVRLWAGTLLAASVVQILFVLQYGVPDPVAHFVAPLAAGLAGAAWWLGRLAPRLRPRMALAGGLTMVALAGAFGLPGAIAFRGRQMAVDARVHNAWRGVPFDDGIVVWQNDWYCRLLAWQILDGERPGLVVANPGMLTWETPRRAFQARTGIDPLAGLRLESDADLPLIGENIARRSRLPVIDFNEQLARTPR